MPFSPKDCKLHKEGQRLHVLCSWQYRAQQHILAHRNSPINTYDINLRSLLLKEYSLG